MHVGCQFRRIIKLDAPFRLRFTVGQLGRTSIRYDYQVFDGGEEVAIEGTMTVVVLENGKPTEIPQTLRAALSGEPDGEQLEGVTTGPDATALAVAS